MGGGGEGRGRRGSVTARISEIFGKCFFFIRNPNLTKKIWRVGGEGVGVWLGSVIFFPQKNPSLKIKKKIVFFFFFFFL